MQHPFKVQGKVFLEKEKTANFGHFELSMLCYVTSNFYFFFFFCVVFIVCNILNISPFSNMLQNHLKLAFKIRQLNPEWPIAY